MSKRRVAARAVAAVAALAALATIVTSPAIAGPAPVVNSTLFGFHSYEGAKPALPGAGTYRTFAPSWCEIEPTRGQFNWTTLDMVVRRAETEWGYNDVLFTFVGSPAWATGGSSAWSGGQGGSAWNMCHDGNSSDDALPPDAAHMSDFAVFAREVANRYDGQHGFGLISSFQVWNEITTQQFFQGSPGEAATMTQRAYAAIKAGNPHALVVSASVQTHRAWHWPIATSYFANLRAKGWPVDVFSAHFYSNSDAAMRSQMIQFQTTLRQTGAPAKPRWNTEVNIADSASSGAVAATVSRVYLNSLRYGITRSYWYLWGSTKGPGSIYMNSALTGRPARNALNTTSAWIVGSRFYGCSKKSSGLVVCTFTRVSTAKSFVVVWNEASTATVPYPVTHKTITPLIGRASSNFTGNVKVGAAPLCIE